jgi:gas vesicle protein
MGVSCCQKSNINKKTELVIDDNKSKEKEKEKEKDIKNKKKFREIQKSIDIYYKDIYNQNNIIQNYISFTNKLNSDINDINNNIKLSVNSQDNNNNENNNQKLDNTGNNFTDKLKNMLDKIYELKSMIEELKDNLFKKVENLYETIQNKFNQKSEINNNDVSINENEIISEKLNELEEINKKLKENKELYDNKKKDIENDIQDMQKKAKDFANNAELLYSTIIEGLKINSDEIKINTKFFKNSMLFDIKEFENPFELFSTKILFKEDDNNDYQQIQNLLRKNWNEKCFVYDDYDLHDVSYELKAVGIPSNTFYSSASFAFYLDTSIEIVGFEIDGKKSNYIYENYLLKFDTHL